MEYVMKRTRILIPEELLVKFLLPQPVKSLVQWRCVSKSWNHIISSKSFIMAYATHQKISLNTNKYLLHDYFPIFRPTRCDVDCREDCLRVYGICDGLLCLSGHGRLLHLDPPIYLYNPIIRKGKKLVLPTREFNSEWADPGCSSLCFGYHENDYKVIKVDVFSRRVWHKNRVCIYSLNDDSWKVVAVEGFAGTSDVGKFWRHPRAKLVNGVAYFLQGDQVVCFDVSRQIIQKIDRPEDIVDYIIKRVNIMEEYGESIAIIGRPACTYPSYRECGNALVMVVLRQADDSCYYWEKKFTYVHAKEKDQRQWCQTMGGFINGDELVIRISNVDLRYSWINRLGGSETQCCEYFLLNVENGTQQQFRLTSKGDPSELKRINIITESLVLLNETTMPPALLSFLVNHKYPFWY